jgi:hypothetical protein
MATRATSMGLATGIALVAMWACADAVSACESRQTRTASASHACCAAKVSTKTACATPAAKVTATAKAPAASPVASLAGASAPVGATAFPSLPNFAQPAPIVAGLWAFIDPETGQLTGPIGNLQVPDDIARAYGAQVELTPVTMPDGSVMVDLQGTLQDYYVLTIDPLGRRSIRCVQDARHAHAPAAPIVLPIADR